MKHSPLTNYLIIVIVFFGFWSFGQNTIEMDSAFYRAEALRFIEPDSSAYYYQKSIDFNLERKDTTRVIEGLLKKSFLYEHNVDYGKSYDGYWDALLLADASKDSLAIGHVYQQLGWLYSFYERDEEALKYFNKALEVHRKLKVDYLDYNVNLRSDYYSIAVFYRDKGEYGLAKKYLDSSYGISKKISTEKNYFAEAELGFIAHKEGDSEKGLKLLMESVDDFKKFEPSYLIVIYYLLGELYNNMGHFNESEYYFRESLALGKRYHTHSNYAPRNYLALSNLYASNNDYEEAFKALKNANRLNDQIFGGRSKNNQHLLEIRDDYRLEKQKQEALIKEQRLAQLEHEDRVWLLKSLILAVTIVFLALFAFLYVRYLRVKHFNEKKVLHEKEKLRAQKQNEILELKNKELTASALRLIEKDEFINAIENKLVKQKDKLDVNVIKRMLKTIQRSPQSNWKEFEARFTAINQSFYTILREKYPDLSQTDQKICALVKLNFPSKDMSKLLGISIQSVHTSRYRLRKKLGLSRTDNLEEFINNI